VTAAGSVVSTTAMPTAPRKPPSSLYANSLRSPVTSARAPRAETAADLALNCSLASSSVPLRAAARGSHKSDPPRSRRSSQIDPSQKIDQLLVKNDKSSAGRWVAPRRSPEAQ